MVEELAELIIYGESGTHVEAEKRKDACSGLTWVSEKETYASFIKASQSPE